MAVLMARLAARLTLLMVEGRAMIERVGSTPARVRVVRRSVIMMNSFTVHFVGPSLCAFPERNLGAVFAAPLILWVWVRKGYDFVPIRSFVSESCFCWHVLHVWYNNALSFLSLQCREKKEIVA